MKTRRHGPEIGGGHTDRHGVFIELLGTVKIWKSVSIYKHRLMRNEICVRTMMTSSHSAFYITTVYPKKYAHGFVVLCFVVVMQSLIMNSHEVFIHIHQGCFAGTGAIVRLPQCQRSKPDGYGKISQCITTTKHSKAKPCAYFLGYTVTLGYPSHESPVMLLSRTNCLTNDELFGNLRHLNAYLMPPLCASLFDEGVWNE